MFQGWSFLLGQIWVMMGLSALLGGLAGWILRGLQKDVRKNAARDVAVPAAEPSDPSPAPQQAAADTDVPLRLNAPRDGRGDDLKRIHGVGPKLETMLNGLGIWHYDQIAELTPDGLAWIDDNLEGFKGRASRDDWVGQARAIVAERG